MSDTSLSQDEIDQQLALLSAHRQRLAVYLRQVATLDPAFAPPGVLIGIDEARAEIARIKTLLRAAGAAVTDAPDDEAPPTAITTKLNPARRLLRAPVGDFVGREREIMQLVSNLSKAAANGGAAAITGVRGMGGIGKTELAYMAAQRLQDAFPQQILVELRGASDAPMSPAQVLQTAIHAFDREAKLPDDINELRNTYWSVLAGKRVLILADDAKDAAQVRPLLPPSGCALLVTSRQHFSLPGMTTLDLGMLSPEEAVALLLEICPRIGEDAPKLAILCGYLPLALRVSASLLANSTRSVRRHVKQLAAERLKHLSDPDDPTASVEASLRLSDDALEPAAQSALRHVSVFPTSFDRQAALAVVAAEGDTEALLDLLKRRSLLEWDAKLKRFSVHELVRAYAAARLVDADAVRLRHARHFVRVASLAEGDLYLKGAVREGLALFDRERTHIDAGWGWVLAHAGDEDTDTLLRDYTNATAYIGELRYDNRRERIPQLEAALAAARRIGDRGAEGVWLGNLGIAYYALGDARHAIACYDQRLEIARELGDQRGKADALSGLGIAYAAVGDVRHAIGFHEQHLAIARELGDRRREGTALGNLGNAYAAVGDARYAIACYEQHLEIARELGARDGEGAALDNLGIAYAAVGDVRRAIECHEQALVINREIGDRRGEGNALGNLGRVYARAGAIARAVDYCEQSLAIKQETGDRSGEAEALNYLGYAFMASDPKRSLALHQQALAIIRQLGYSQLESAFLIDQGETLIILDELPKASECFEKAAAIAESIGLRGDRVRARWHIGRIFEKQSDLGRAVVFMQELVDFEREIGHIDAEKDAAYLEKLQQQLAGQGTSKGAQIGGRKPS